MSDLKEIYLVTGGAGFIVCVFFALVGFLLTNKQGSAVAKRLFDEGHNVHVVDMVPAPSTAYFTKYIQADLRDTNVCRGVMQGVSVVLHFAANMGGMGIIHTANDFTVYRDNHTITLNVLEAATSTKSVHLFLFASSACVYPNDLQTANDKDVQLAESDVFHSGTVSPQGLYGLEKLVGEMLLQQASTTRLAVRIARLHNVFGPGGSWNDGREKAPAALARKAVAIKLSEDPSSSLKMEIWGDGDQRRSFLFIDDCVEGLLRLLQSDKQGPFNIGSEEAVSIRELAEIALEAVRVPMSPDLFVFDTTKPVGVASRNSNNNLVKRELGWEPKTALRDGMAQTVGWIEAQVNQLLVGRDDRRDLLRGLQNSPVIDLNANTINFGILLPITSRGGQSPQGCLDCLQKFAASLASTTWRDVRSGFQIKVYLAIDDDDHFLLDGAKAETILHNAGIWDVSRLECHVPRGHVCWLWRQCATAAWKDNCDYMALFGDDVELLDEGWLRGIHQAFQDLSMTSGVEPGFGCVAFTDISFPGMPTFPVIHRSHMDMFAGEVIPDAFINQDGDPFLFQLYRRFGSSQMARFRLRNAVGGSNDARYEKKPLEAWTYNVLDEATRKVESTSGVTKKLTLDVVVPSFRVDMDTLSRILELQPSPTCEAMFIVIVDNPNAPSLAALQVKFGHRPDVRIRINRTNLGASASRNRGISECAGEWMFFLDDDVVPNPDILVEAERAIRANPDCAGLVGTTLFPPADTVFKTAVHLAGVTYFWDIATKLAGCKDIPWGVTANLLAPRVKDGVQFDLRFPKTGGGEDIDFCLRKRNLFVQQAKPGFQAAPKVVATHSWWHSGQRSYTRFYMWAKGDGELVVMFPELCYTDPSPTSAQLVLYTLLSTALALLFGYIGFARRSSLSFLAIFVVNITHDLYRHLIRQKTNDPRSTLTGVFWTLAIMESTLIRVLSEWGRLVGQIERGEWGLAVGQQRFDWFATRVGNGPRDNERKNSRERFFLWLLLVALATRMSSRVEV
ncbi:hypothetical protein HMN09_00280500 [Mycena chlorophos]|uniref:Glycosyltransferase family 2 protein n=1 Tax=Mycena chlorophos TaxID=658473 RepID=A0A8H6TMH9_MYCCL|nr:hypothetical protein HMN09_00280500 [Mycena chlorophos]